MKIYAASRGDAASYYRIISPFAVLRYRTDYDIKVGRLNLDVLEDCSVLWLQQHADPTTEIIVRDFQDQGGIVVYDVDDWLFSLPASWPCYDDYYQRGSGNPRSRLFLHERLLRLADVVTTTTPYLAKKLQDKLGPEKRIEILPNCILQGDWDTVIPAIHNMDGPVLGWFGTGNHWDDWTEIVDAVDEALERVNGYLALMGAPELVTMFPERLAERTLVHSLVPWDRLDEVRRLIGACDAGLAWCTDRFEANRCRSPLKAIQYGAAGVPVVASETVYGKLWPKRGRDAYLYQHDVTPFGLIAKTPRGLQSALLEALVYAKPGALYLASEWQREVWRSHSYERQAMRWLKVLESLEYK